MAQLLYDLAQVVLVQVYPLDFGEGRVEFQISAPKLVYFVYLLLRLSHTSTGLVYALLGYIDVVDLVAYRCTCLCVEFGLPFLILAKLCSELLRVDETLVR